MHELGAYLQQVRETQNISIAELSDRTKILPRFLIAIEQGDFEKLPGAVYAKAFLRLYAREIGLDVDDVMHRYAAQDQANAVETGIQKPDGSIDENRKHHLRLDPSAWQWFFVVALTATVMWGRWYASTAPHKKVVPNPALEQVKPEAKFSPLLPELQNSLGSETPSEEGQMLTQFSDEASPRSQPEPATPERQEPIHIDKPQNNLPVKPVREPDSGADQSAASQQAEQQTESPGIVETVPPMSQVIVLPQDADAEIDPAVDESTVFYPGRPSNRGESEPVSPMDSDIITDVESTGE